MSKIFILFLCFFTFSIHAQINEIGIFLGGSNYVGDIGRTTYIAPNEPAFGILYKWNKSPRHSYRFSYTQSQISGDDHDSKESGRNNRGYNFTNNIKELSAGLEFNFFDFNLHEERPKFTPYVYSGLSYFFYDNLQLDTSGDMQKNGIKSNVAIPITLGVKTNFSRNFVLGLEVGARYTFTDNIDGSNPSNSNLAFGNINNSDWYVFSGATLTYTFGDKPCYCAD